MVGATVEQAVVRAFAVCNQDKALGDDVKAGDTAYRLVDAVPAPGGIAACTASVFCSGQAACSPVKTADNEMDGTTICAEKLWLQRRLTKRR